MTLRNALSPLCRLTDRLIKILLNYIKLSVWVYAVNNNNNKCKWRMSWWADLHTVEPRRCCLQHKRSLAGRGRQDPLPTNYHHFYSPTAVSAVLSFSTSTSTYFFIFSFTYDVPLLILWGYSSASTFSFTEPRSRTAEINVTLICHC